MAFRVELQFVGSAGIGNETLSAGRHPAAWIGTIEISMNILDKLARLREMDDGL